MTANEINKDGTYKLYKQGSDSPIGEIPGKQLQFLIDQLEEEYLEDRDYAITPLTIEYLRAQGAQPELQALLRQALGDLEEVTVVWKPVK